MKKIIICLNIVLIFMQMNVFAIEYTPEKAVNAIISYEDNHEITRFEALKTINRMIGVNDKVVLSYCNGKMSDYTPKLDIKYDTYLGRFMDLLIYPYAERDLYTKERFNGDDRFFGGNDYATAMDVVLWMVMCLDKGYEDYPEEISRYKTAIIEKAIEYGLINVDESYDIYRKLSAQELKVLSSRFLDKTVVNYYKNKWHGEFNTNEGFKYIDLFNETYTDMVITIKNDGIYLGDKRIEYEGSYYITDDGAMMIPVRLFAELTGYDDEIIWDQENQSVYMTKRWNPEFNFTSEISLKMLYNECKFLNSWGTFELDHSTCNINDHMYVPMREMLEKLAYDVIWRVEQ